MRESKLQIVNFGDLGDSSRLAVDPSPLAVDVVNSANSPCFSLQVPPSWTIFAWEWSTLAKHRRMLPNETYLLM
jgi:hypothetical protein